MEQSNAPSTKGKGLGLAGMIIGIVAAVWACIPLLGAGALWVAVVGLILSVIAFFMAKGGNNPKKGAIVAGIILNVVAIGLAIFWIWKIKQATDELGTALDQLGKDMKEEMQHTLDSMENAE